MSEDLNKRNKQEWIESAAAVRQSPTRLPALFLIASLMTC